MRFLIFTVFSFFISPFTAQAQISINIPIKGNIALYQPRNYYISSVVDDRTDKSTAGKTKDGDIIFPGGLEQTILHSIERGKNKNMPISMHITQLDIKERSAGSKRQFNLSMGIAYYAGATRLTAYNGSSYAQSYKDAAPYIEKLILKNISDNMKEFDSWVGKNKNAISAAPTVEMHVYFSNLSDNKNKIAYSRSRKLFITDFQGEPDKSSPGAAATMSGIGMKYQSSTLHNKTTVDVTISVYFDKTRSWMKDIGKNVTILLHEQRHFDITAIKACELKQLIEAASFTPGNYKTELSKLLNRMQQEGTEIQNEYDRETEHGTIIDKQEAWNKKIEALLSKQKCF